MSEVISSAIDPRDGGFVLHRHIKPMKDEALTLADMAKIVGGSGYWWQQGGISSTKKKKKLLRTNLSAAKTYLWSN